MNEINEIFYFRESKIQDKKYKKALQKANILACNAFDEGFKPTNPIKNGMLMLDIIKTV